MISLEKEKLGLWLIAIVTVASIISLLFIDAIPQDITYHLFSNNNEILGVLNFWNVFSNLPFALVGLLGLYKIVHQ